jgi:ubiquinone/menaquinone biosynthesis C-methylase UbiE
MEAAKLLPQADATGLVDSDRLESAVKDMYGQVADEAAEDLHFELGRVVAERLGYDPGLLDRIPERALASFAGVGHHFDLARVEEGERVLDLGSGSGTDVFCAAVLTGPGGHVTGVDFTEAQLEKARALAADGGFGHVDFTEASIEELPFADGSFDLVISNGVINLAPWKQRVFEEAARVLRPGGRFAVSDIVSGKALKERTRRDVDLWAACIAGAIPEASYEEAMERAGLRIEGRHGNDYGFMSKRAQSACSIYDVKSVSLLAVR